MELRAVCRLMDYFACAPHVCMCSGMEVGQDEDVSRSKRLHCQDFEAARRLRTQAGCKHPMMNGLASCCVILQVDSTGKE